MNLFDQLEAGGHEQIVFRSDPDVGYRGIIAIHDTSLGPALGGIRFWAYPSEEAAVVDALRLSRGMTYKAAVAGINLGGGKSLILGNPDTRAREALYRAHGRAIQSLRGRYIAAADVGTRPSDLEFVRLETEHVTGLATGSGDSAPLTAHGTVHGIQACVEEVFGLASLADRHIAVQGLGSVGAYLCDLLAAAGARLTVADPLEARTEHVRARVGARVVPPSEIHRVEADVFAPCALGGVINDQTLPELGARIVAGAANNQLATPAHGVALRGRGILYAPDYVINAGGLICVYGALQGWTSGRTRKKVDEIHDTLRGVFQESRREEVTPEVVADRIAERRIQAAREAKRGLRRPGP